MKIFSKVIGVLSLSLLVSGCMASKSYQPLKVSLKSVATGNQKIKTKGDSLFQDRFGTIEGSYAGGVYGGAVSVNLQNNSKSVAKILWDEGFLVDPNGQSHRLIHEGVRLMARNESQPPTMVPPNGSHRDSIYSASNIYWDPAGFWVNAGLLGHLQSPTLPPKDYSKRSNKYNKLSPEEYAKAREEIATFYERELFGKSFKIFLPIQFGETRRDYELSFVVDGFEVQAEKESPAKPKS